MTYVKTHWINNEEPSIDADNLNHMEQGIEDAQYPDGGSAGQLLAKTTNGTEWVDAPNSAVWGLIQGQLNEQEDLYAELESKIVAPAGGTTGQYLRKTAGGTEWADAGSIDTVNNISPDANKNVQTVIELTQAQYNALANPDPNVTYLITDGINNPANNTINGSGVSYDNTDSGLTATTVQGAIDENASAITDLNNGLTVLTFSGNISDFMRTYVPSKNLEQNRVYSATFTDPNWDSAFGWVMRIDTNRYVGEFSNTNGYHIWASNINGTFSQKAISYQ